MKIAQPLRFATIPEEDESLVGVVARATADHVLLDLNRVLRRANISMDRPGHLAKLEPDVLARLAPVLGCTVEQVVSRAMGVVAPEAKTSSVAVGAGYLNVVDIEIERRRISPLTVKAEPYHHEPWLLRILPYCPVSYELLRSDCSECGAPLRWKKSVGIGACETCEHAVAPTDAPLLEEGLREDYTLFSRLLSSRSAVRDSALARLSAQVQHVEGETLIRMVLGLGACVHLESRFINRKTLYRLPPATLGAIVSTGTGMLRHWPVRLQTWAREEAGRLAANGVDFQKLRRRLQNLGNRSHVAQAQAVLIREALPGVFRNVQRSFEPLSDTLLFHEAAAMLGATYRLTELVDKKLLRAEEFTNGKLRRISFSRTVVKGLRKSMDGSISIPLLGRVTGLPHYAIENLIDHRILGRETDPALHYLRHGSSVTRESIDRLRASIFGRNLTDPPDDIVPLGTAARRIGGRLKPWTAVIIALADGSLPSWIDPNATPDTPWLRSVTVQPAELARFDDVWISAPAGSEYSPPEDCCITDAREILNLSSTLSVDLQDVFAEDIAARDQRGPTKAVPLKVVLEKARAEISVAEICARANWSPRQAKWALRPFASARTRCGWDRNTIEKSRVLEEQIDWDIRPHRRDARQSGSFG